MDFDRFIGFAFLLRIGKDDVARRRCRRVSPAV